MTYLLYNQIFVFSIYFKRKAWGGRFFVLFHVKRLNRKTLFIFAQIFCIHADKKVFNICFFDRLLGRMRRGKRRFGGEMAAEGDAIR